MMISLLFLFLEQLPDSVIPNRCANDFYLASTIRNENIRAINIHCLLRGLPLINLRIITRLTKFWRNIRENKHVIIEDKEISEAFGQFLLGENTVHLSSPSKDELPKKFDPMTASKTMEDILHTYAVLPPKVSSSTLKWKKRKEAKSVLLQGTVERLKSLLMVHRQLDPDYIDCFVLTHEYFMTTEQFVNDLLKLWGDMAEESEFWREELQTRISNILKVWLRQWYQYRCKMESSSSCRRR